MIQSSVVAAGRPCDAAMAFGMPKLRRKPVQSMR
jgi:hypothetical protein